MGFGRPSKYSKAMVTKSSAYLKNYKTAIPSIEGLAYHLGIARSTVYEWAKDEEKQDFSDILEQILQQQFLVTMDGAIKNDLNAQIAKLTYHQKARKLIEIDVVKKFIHKLNSIARDGMLNLPDRLAPKLASLTDVHEITTLMNEEIMRMCDEFQQIEFKDIK